MSNKIISNFFNYLNYIIRSKIYTGKKITLLKKNLLYKISLLFQGVQFEFILLKFTR